MIIRLESLISSIKESAITHGVVDFSPSDISGLSGQILREYEHNINRMQADNIHPSFDQFIKKNNLTKREIYFQRTKWATLYLFYSWMPQNFFIHFHESGDVRIEHNPE